MFTLDVSGHDDLGRAGINRFGGLFATIEEAAQHGIAAAKAGRLHFAPSLVWVRDEEGGLVTKIDLNPDP